MFFPPGPLKWGSTSWTHWSSKKNLAQDFARQRLGPQGSEKTCPSGDSLTRPCGSTGHSPHCLAAHWNHKLQRNKLGNGGCHVKLHLEGCPRQEMLTSHRHQQLFLRSHSVHGVFVICNLGVLCTWSSQNHLWCHSSIAWRIGSGYCWDGWSILISLSNKSRPYS